MDATISKQSYLNNSKQLRFVGAPLRGFPWEPHRGGLLVGRASANRSTAQLFATRGSDTVRMEALECIAELSSAWPIVPVLQVAAERGACGRHSPGKESRRRFAREGSQWNGASAAKSHNVFALSGLAE